MICITTYYVVIKLQEVEPEPSTSQLNRVSVEELLQQLQITQTELENVRVSYEQLNSIILYGKCRCPANPTL